MALPFSGKMRRPMKPLPRILVLLAGVAAVIGCGSASGSRRGAASECAGCHRRSLDAQRALASVHPPFAEENCAACHARHGPRGENVLVDSEPALCLSCHDDEEFQRGHVHSAVQMSGCTGCHRPHASANAKLLAEPPATLCGTCHTSVEKAHGGYRVEGARCAMCHVPHSSSGDKLLAEVTHEVLSDCSSCHAPTSSPRPLALAKPPPALCFDCHSEEEKAFAKKVVHEPVRRGASRDWRAMYENAARTGTELAKCLAQNGETK